MRHQLGGGELSCFFLSSHDIAFKTRNCVPLMTQIYNFHSYKFITRWIHSILERYNVSLERKYQILHRLDFYYFTRSCLLCFFSVSFFFQRLFVIISCFMASFQSIDIRNEDIYEFLNFDCSFFFNFVLFFMCRDMYQELFAKFVKT